MQAGKMYFSSEWLKQPRNWSLQQNFVQFVLVGSVKPVNLFGSAWMLGNLVQRFHRFKHLRKNNNNDIKTPT